MSRESLRIPSDALLVLSLSKRWNLSDQRWRNVESTLQAIARAVEVEDSEALRQGLAALHLLGPTRVAAPVNPGMGAAVTGPAPGPVMELANQIIHTLEVRMSGNGAPDDAPSPGQGGGRGGEGGGRGGEGGG